MTSKWLFLCVFPAVFVAGCATSTVEEEPGIDQDEVTSGFICNNAETKVGFGNGNPETWDFGESTYAAVRAAGRPEVGFDRFVLEFKPGSKIARYRVTKQNTPTFHLGESDETVTLKGNAGLGIMVWLGGTWMDANPTPSRFDVRNGSAMLEARLNYLFEGDMGWALGLKKHASCYRVFKLASPPRLVVDVQR